eukprot:CAMPEP_0204828628 /NCGR_PEP_ID=MMETSP1346-20131115/6496_1 /ASSEMBLY_ACC=CAM_ASM_000771 /TAXON_ID=215587 /ORGANISM="Aplanochytrium stocchinoi, Strain GSBS06" /LENGTH=457 /DNA_ID=CAMNT_0051957853 /DNA_START=42 /DNA_END=1412 /DNA_ORIENTATION=+
MAKRDSGTKKGFHFVLLVCFLSFLPILAFYHKAHGLPTLFDVYTTTYRNTHAVFKGNKERLDELRELLLLQNQNVSSLLIEAQEGQLYKAKFQSLKAKGLQVTKELLELQGHVGTLQKELVENNRQLYSRKAKGVDEIKRLNTTYIRYFSEFKKKLKKLNEDKERQAKVNERLEEKLEEATQTIRELQQSKQDKAVGGFLPSDNSNGECLKKLKVLQAELLSLKLNKDSFKSTEIIINEDDDDTQFHGDKRLNEGKQLPSEHDESTYNRRPFPNYADETSNAKDPQFYAGSTRNRLIEGERLSGHIESAYDRRPNLADEIPSRYRHRFETDDVSVYRGNDDSRYRYGMSSRPIDGNGMHRGSNDGYGISSRSNDEWALDNRFGMTANKRNDDQQAGFTEPMYPNLRNQNYGSSDSGRKCQKPVFNSDREGSSYFQKGITSARNCQMLCKKDPECKAW